MLRGAVYAAWDARATAEFHAALGRVIDVWALWPLVVANDALEQARADFAAAAGDDEAAELAWYADALRNVGGLP